MNTYRLIALDLDGTLLGSDKRVSARNASALAEAARRGVRVMISSGRILPDALSCVEGLDCVSCVSASNGAYVEELGSGRVIQDRGLTRDDYAAVLEVLEGRDLFYTVYGARTIYIDERVLGFCPYPIMRAEGSMAERRLLRDLPAETRDAPWPKHKVYVALDRPERAGELAALRAEFAAMPGLCVSSSGALNIEITAAGVDKGASLRAVCGAFGIGREESLAVGDGENDAPMLAWAGLGVAMRNADATALAAARASTAGNDEDGVALAVERHVLG